MASVQRELQFRPHSRLLAKTQARQAPEFSPNIDRWPPLAEHQAGVTSEGHQTKSEPPKRLQPDRQTPEEQLLEPFDLEFQEPKLLRP
jgi:hypothetical protein